MATLALSRTWNSNGNEGAGDLQRQALELKRQGWKRKDIASALEIDQRKVGLYLTQGKQQLAWELKQQGWKHEDIATELGVSSKTLRRWIKNIKERGAAKHRLFETHFERHRKTSVVELVDFIIGKVGQPSEIMAVAALLETYGIRDADAQHIYGEPDVFALAECVYVGCLNRPSLSVQPAPQVVRQNWGQTVQHIARSYVGAALYDSVFFVQAIALLAFGYNLGFYTLFAPRETAIVIGAIILSFIFSGGLIRAIGYAGSFYLGQQNYILAARMVRRIVLFGLGIVAALSLVSYLANSLVLGLSSTNILIFLIYFLLFSGILLFSAVMYSLQQRLGLFVMSLVGLAVVVVIMQFTNWGIYAGHWAGMSTAIFTAWIWITLTFKSRNRSRDARIGGELPPIRSQIAALAPYFIYGTLYYVFATASRMVAYSQITPTSFAFRIHKSYEGGLIWALLPFLLIGPLLEGVAQMLINDLARRQSNRDVVEHKYYHSAFTAYIFPSSILVLALIVLNILAYLAVMSLWNAKNQVITDLFAPNPQIIVTVFLWTALGNLLLVWGLLNTSLLLSSRKLWLPIKAVFLAALINVLVGVLFNHVGGYQYSVIGFAVGGLCFALLTSRGVWVILQQVDYHDYSSYWNFSM
jgi:hypothetical protein